MCTEIKKSKQLLEKVYIERQNNPNANIKYKHLYDCINILKKLFPLTYWKYIPTILLHDIGRFFENEEDFNHAYYGVSFLSKNGFKDPKIILPIKYHESDENWRKLLNKDKVFIILSKKNKKEIIQRCEMLISIDIISNMEYIMQKEFENKEINPVLIEKMFTDKLGDKQDIKNDIDEVIYILCGIKLIENKKCIKYLKKNNIITNLLSKIQNEQVISSIKDYLLKKYKI